MAKVLLEKGADPNTKDNDGRTDLMTASINGRVDLVRLLLDKGSDPSLQGAANHLELVKLLLDKGADINAKDRWRGDTALMHAVHFNQIDVVSLLLDKGADVNAQDKFEDTALKEAQKKGYTQIVELLKAHGAKE